MSDYRIEVKSAKQKNNRMFICVAVAILILTVSGCSESDTDVQTTVTASVPEQSPSAPDETDRAPLQENLDECKAFRARLIEAVTNTYEPDQSPVSVGDLLEVGTSVRSYFLLDKEKLFKIIEVTNPATDTLDGYYLISLKPGGIEDQERIYVLAEFDQYPILYITYATASLYIPDGPVICLEDETPGLMLEEDEQTGDIAGTIDEWYIRDPAQPENEYEMLIYKDDTLAYAIKTRNVINESSNSIRDAGNERLSRSIYFGCADKQLIYTFKFGMARDTYKLTNFAGNLTEDMITDMGTSD